MVKTDPRVDAYIERAADFAKPILRHFREVVHEGAPECEETIKWGFPHFTRKGILCSMAAFKEHCAIGFWKGALFLPDGEEAAKAEAMGEFGRVTSLDDLPARKVLLGYVRKAVELNETGVKAPSSSKKRKKALPVPKPFRAALDRHPQAAAWFEKLSPSQRRDYIEWIAEAKREATRERRIVTAVEWIAQGKPRNWRYTAKRGGAALLVPLLLGLAAPTTAQEAPRAGAPVLDMHLHGPGGHGPGTSAGGDVHPHGALPDLGSVGALRGRFPGRDEGSAVPRPGVVPHDRPGADVRDHRSDGATERVRGAERQSRPGGGVA
jgi:uncharacterized protein YdeI (YjbR/CyaY-like superfamily)